MQTTACDRIVNTIPVDRKSCSQGGEYMEQFVVVVVVRLVLYCLALLNLVSANTTNTFNARFDELWYKQEIAYDFRAQLHGTG